MKIGIIIVLYNKSYYDYSTIATDKNLLLFLIDNTPNQDLNIECEGIKYISLKENLGIASAQNIGIEHALNSGCTHIVFFDQDSSINLQLIKGLVTEYERIRSFHPNLFALGPTAINGRTNAEYKPAYHDDIADECGFVKKQDIISSGCCVSTDKIKQVGLLDDKLFIDYVDHEWCWRANSLGLVCGVTKNARMTHYIGQKERKLFGITIIFSSPFRYYYQTRNWLWLIRRDYVPTKWKLSTSIKKLFYPILFPFLNPSWKQIYKNIYLGWLAGLNIKK